MNQEQKLISFLLYLPIKFIYILNSLIFIIIIVGVVKVAEIVRGILQKLNSDNESNVPIGVAINSSTLE